LRTRVDQAPKIVRSPPTVEVLAAEAKAMRADLLVDAEKHRWFRRAIEKSPSAVVDDLLARYFPVRFEQLAAQEAKVDRARSIAGGYRALASLLAAKLEPQAPIGGADRSAALAREKMIDEIVAVRRMITALGATVIAEKLPLETLDRLEAKLRDELGALIAIRDEAIAHRPQSALLAQDLDARRAAAAIGERLGAPKLGEKLLAIGDELRAGKATYAQNLVALALLVDQATTALDYRTSKMGKHADSKSRYRSRDYEPWSAYEAKGRQAESRSTAQAAIERALKAKDPSKAIEKALVSLFLAEIGASSKDLRPDPKAIREALFHELLAPLRALRETIDDMVIGAYGVPPPAGVDLPAAIRASVDAITKAVAQGELRALRYESPWGLAQLAMLDERQRTIWRSAELETQGTGGSGQGLRTREIDGLELFWAPKIGGPSHGFDRGGHCTLPLLTNGRTKVIVVDDETWPSNSAARAYLRVLPDREGRPALYLEPTQRDFPHRDRDTEANRDAEWTAAHRVLLQHAHAKAQLMGLPLSIGKEYAAVAQALGLVAIERPQVFQIHPSGGVREASDTLLPKDADPTRPEGHDWVNVSMQLTPPLPRLWIEAAGTPG
jgi:hypothetical protein